MKHVVVVENAHHKPKLEVMAIHILSGIRLMRKKLVPLLLKWDSVMYPSHHMSSLW